MPIKRKAEKKTTLDPHVVDAVLNVSHSLQSMMIFALWERVVLLNKSSDYVDKIDSEYIMVDLFYLLSYAYYVKDDPLLPDGTFDRLCKRGYTMAKKPNAIPALKELKSAFKAGTGYSLDYENNCKPPVDLVYNFCKHIQLIKETANAKKEETHIKARPAKDARPKRVIRRPRRS